MKKLLSIAILGLAAISMMGCQRIETGEVGLRVGLDKQTQAGELLPGSFNQTLVGEVITFPVREIRVNVQNRQPLTKENSTMADVDFQVIYSINPTAVSDLWTTKSKGFHVYDEKSHDYLLMANYIETLANSAVFKAIRKYEALAVNDNRKAVEDDIKAFITQALTEEKLDGALKISQIQVANLQIDPVIAKTANDVVRARNELATKTIEVQTAQQEANRVAALNSNARAIEYMNAESLSNMSKAMLAGKVASVVVPFDFKGIVNVK